MDKKYHIVTMGCSLNENDSEKIAGMAEKMGYTLEKNIDKATLIIFNTCSIRENAEQRLFGKLGAVKEIKSKNNAIIAIGGCMPQEEHVIKKIKASYPYVDVVFGTHTIHKFPELVQEAINSRKKAYDIQNIDGEIYEGLPIKRADNKKAYVTIMYGCNNFCSYCIVPYVRGRERSRKKEDILNEVKFLAKEGYMEITLLGQNVNSYKNLQTTFAKLLEEVDKIDGIEKISFISPHPKDFSDELIETIANSKKVSRLIHLPLQSGSTKVLEAMNRKYTKESYLELVRKMHERIPNLVLSTDIIVGFPGETEEDFKDTLDVITKVDFEQAFMFIYSPRMGTKAAAMEDQISEKVKHERFDRLKKLVDSKIEKINEKYVGTIQEILVEGTSKNNDEMLTGRTSTNKIVVFDGDKNLIGKRISVKLTSSHLWFFKGEKI